MAFCYGLFNLCIVGVRVCSQSEWVSKKGCSLSLVLFIFFMDRISRCSQVVEGLKFSDIQILYLLFADDGGPFDLIVQ